jgi:sulfur carrier protein
LPSKPDLIHTSLEINVIAAIPKVCYILNSKGMELKINNQLKQFATDNHTVQTLLDLEIPNKQNEIAVAVNNTVIQKSFWNTQNLLETEDVLIIAPTQGG